MLKFLRYKETLWLLNKVTGSSKGKVTEDSQVKVTESSEGKVTEDPQDKVTGSSQGKVTEDPQGKVTGSSEGKNTEDSRVKVTDKSQGNVTEEPKVKVTSGKPDEVQTSFGSEMVGPQIEEMVSSPVVVKKRKAKAGPKSSKFHRGPQVSSIITILCITI